MDKSTRMTLRLPDYLRKWIEQDAKTESRTMTGHIVEILKEAKERKEQQPET